MDSTKLSEVELTALQKRVGAIQQLNALVALHQEAAQDLVNAALAARGLDSKTHQVGLDGTIKERDGTRSA